MANARLAHYKSLTTNPVVAAVYLNNAMYTERLTTRFQMKNRPRRPGDRQRSGNEAIVLVLSRAATVLVLVIETSHDDRAILRTRTLEVYCLWIDAIARSFETSQSLGGLHRIVAMLTRMAMKSDGVAGW